MRSINFLLTYLLGREHWRHLANTVEPSVCCGDVALCQITFTTCYSIVSESEH